MRQVFSCPHCGKHIEIMKFKEKPKKKKEEPWIRCHDQAYWGREKAIELAKERLEQIKGGI